MRPFLPILLAVLTAAALPGSEITFQNGTNSYEGASDTTLAGIRENQRHHNHGQHEKLFVAGVAHGGMRQLGLIQFADITGPSGIPKGTPIHKAYLELYKIDEPSDQGQYQKVATKDLVINSYRLMKKWEAGNGRNEPVEGAATFSYRAFRSDIPEFWGDANQIEEGPVRNVDYDTSSAPKAPLIVGSNDFWMRWDITEYVQQWVNDPETNHGVMLMARSSYVGSIFASCDASDTEFRPKLVIEY